MSIRFSHEKYAIKIWAGSDNDFSYDTYFFNINIKKFGSTSLVLILFLLLVASIHPVIFAAASSACVILTWDEASTNAAHQWSAL